VVMTMLAAAEAEIVANRKQASVGLTKD